MVMAKASNEEFVEAWNRLGSATLVAKELGLSNRRVCTRAAELGLKTWNAQNPAYAVSNNKARINVQMDTGVVLVGSDAHYWPNEVTTAHRAFVLFAKNLDPKFVVLNGDVFDGARASRHAPIAWEKKPSVIEELETVKVRTAEIVEASPKSHHLWPAGNHDLRFETRLATQVPEYASVPGFHLKDHFPLWTPCWGVHINDNVVVKHRWKGGIHATYQNTLQAGVTTVTGHLHSLKVTPYTDYTGTRYGVDTGTLADPWGPQFTDYTEDGPKNWRSGFVVLTFHDGKLMPPELVEVIDEGIVWFRGQRISV